MFMMMVLLLGICSDSVTVHDDMQNAVEQKTYALSDCDLSVYQSSEYYVITVNSEPDTAYGNTDDAAAVFVPGRCNAWAYITQDKEGTVKKITLYVPWRMQDTLKTL